MSAAPDRSQASSHRSPQGEGNRSVSAAPDRSQASSHRSPQGSPVSAPLLDVRGLRVAFGDRTVVHGLDWHIAAGEKVALVGESGSGKTVSALSLLRLIPEAQVSGQALLDGVDVLSLSERGLRGVRGDAVSVIFQEPMSALNPLMAVGDQIAEVLMLKRGLSAAAAHAEAVHWLHETGIPEPERRARSFAHQLSGGQRQRAMIAMALASRPKLLIADEPTTALDVSLRGQILALLADLQARHGMAVLMITHDLPMVRRFADRLIVMQHGHAVEQGTVAQVFGAPTHPYTRLLIDSQPPALPAVAADAAPAVVAQAQSLQVQYPVPRPGIRGWFGHDHFTAVHGATLALQRGRTLGVVGESGSGKSSLAMALLGLTPSDGALHFGDPQTPAAPTQAAPLHAWKAATDLQRHRALRRRVQVVFQDPFSSLSPRMTVQQIVGEGLDIHFPALSRDEHNQRVRQALVDVGLCDTAQQADGWLSRYPHQCSGGQRQRLAIARALLVEPEILVLDEPTSALDVTVQRQVLTLLQRLQDERGLAYLLITHDMAVIRAMAHRVLVMHQGQVVEHGEAPAVLHAPQHPYTQSLLAASL
jgi:microcin C transport system ATP-binding protein